MTAIKRIHPLGFQWETQNPFLFCVHHEDYFPKGNDALGPASSLAGRNLGNDFELKDGWRMYHGHAIPGFPGHPHRGFETLTVVRTGMVDHADSAGGAGRYGNGDLQWMTAGRGLMHSEMFPLLQQNADNPLELFQIWLNLPGRSKMAEPAYKMFWSESIPHIQPESGIEIEVLAGELFGHRAPEPPPDSWAYERANHVGVFNIQLAPNLTLALPALPPGINRSLYVYQGEQIAVAGTPIPAYHGTDVDSRATVTLTNGANPAKILILQGRPIDEPVIQHGPFVMNTKQEIQQAFLDYQRTQFGGWPWDRPDPVHPRDAGRFARYTDGREERPAH